MYIVLENRPDRMGANLSWYIMQIIYAHKRGWFIHYHGSDYDKSIFFMALRKFVDKYNYDLGERLGSHDHHQTEYMIEHSQQDWPGNNMKVCRDIRCDLLSYFHTHLYDPIRAILDTLLIEHPDILHNISLDYKKLIAVHVRLDDVVIREPYDGCHSTDYYRSKLNKGNINIDLEEERLFFMQRGIHIQGWGRDYNTHDCQAPIPESTIESYISKARRDYPDHNVVVVTSPVSEVSLPYPIIKSTNPDTDLAILSNANVVICSKSLFCFSTLYFGKAVKRFIPMWGHIAGAGLSSKYDNNTDNVYLY